MDEDMTSFCKEGVDPQYLVLLHCLPISFSPTAGLIRTGEGWSWPGKFPNAPAFNYGWHLSTSRLVFRCTSNPRSPKHTRSRLVLRGFILRPTETITITTTTKT